MNLNDIPLETERGEPRGVGVEIEFAELGVMPAAAIVRDLYGGEIVQSTDYETLVVTPEFGEFRVELDVDILKRMARERADTGDDPGLVSQVSEEVIAHFVQQVAPCEIVTPPLPFDHMAKLDRLTDRLRCAGAKGTSDAWVYAFGVHFNPRAPSLSAAGILAYLRAFALLYDWLKSRLDVDFSRRLSPFINAFPNAYVELILAPGYQPDLPGLIDDYLQHNPTRNRALDLLPLFAEIDPERVNAAVDDALVKARPTYHYRLSNSRIGDPDWRLSDEWRHWLIVEQLAQTQAALEQLAADYLAQADNPLHTLTSAWLTHTEQWLSARVL